MKRQIIVSLAILVLFTVTTGTTQPLPKIPMRDFFKNPQQAYFQISPDGQYISFTQPYENRMNIFVQKVGSKDATRVTSITDRDIFQYFWKGNSRLLFLKDFGGDENFHLFGVDKDFFKI